MITWGFPVSLDLWLAGMAAGAYLAAFLAKYFGRHADNRLLHTSLYIGVPAAIGGVSFLLADLSYPLRFWHLFVSFNITSPMSIGSWLLMIWITCGVLVLFLWHTRKWNPIKKTIVERITKYLHWIVFFASMFLMTYTGVLLSASNEPLWTSTVLLPPLFVVSAVSTGASILILVGMITRMWKTYGDTLKRMVQLVAVVIVIEILFLLAYFFMLSRSGIPGASESMFQLIIGEMAIPFWLGVVLLAILLPFAFNVFHWGRRLEERKIVFASSIASSTCVIVGGLILRTVIVFGGQL